MKSTFLIIFFLGFTALGAQAECYYAYKAKKDNPLQLHLGVIKVDTNCNASLDASPIAARINVEGWSLLVVLGQVSPGDLPARKESFGAFFLRY
ncbi:MAG: hypothetical protein NWQ64_02840 [Paracoccaceae bacterium]|jgi:hypothetical protein|nr:MAG: hypothetical protein ABR99_09570 [Rhodobacter sp. BACL10 MAG-121220-bin24]MDP5357062.1 hypothetical protein [Paracoccaceae bacterium]